MSTNSFGQTEQFYESWRWTHFTKITGLPSDIVEDIIEADDSTVWVSTAKGIAWYDGYRWNPIIVDSLYPEQRVRKVVKFANDKIFVILNRSLYIGNKNGFLKFTTQNISFTGMISYVCPIDTISYLCVFENADSASIILIKNNKVNMLKSPPPGILLKSKNNIWYAAGANTGFYKFTNGKWKTIIKYRDSSEKNIAVRSIVENKQGKIVIAFDAPKQRVGVWDYDQQDNLIPTTEINQPVRSLDISNNNEVFVVYESGEIHIRNRNKWNKIYPIPRQMINILAIRYRDNNDMWIATEQGLYLFNRRKDAWTKNIYSFSDLNNVVMEIYKTREGDLWVGTLDGVEVILKVGEKKYIRNINKNKLGLITGINQDSQNHIWISSGAGFKGVFEWDGNHWIHHSNTFGNINYHKICKDRSGRLWFLGLGVNTSDPSGYIMDNRKLLRIDSLYQLPGNRIYSFAESAHGIFWLGTIEGLVRIKDGIVRQWNRNEYWGKNPKVYTLTVDLNEKVWFSTFSPHLGTVLDNDSIQWIWKNEEIYEYNQKVWDLKCDESGVLWAATTKGLFCYNNSTWSNYSDESGAYLRELRVVLPTEDKIYVGGHGIGMRVMDRKNISIPIKVFISKTIVEENVAYCSWTPISYWGAIPTEQIKTRYRLDKQEWTDWSTQHQITITNLFSGQHTLTVEAIDAYGFVGESKTNTVFYIEPPVFYRPMYAIPFVFMVSLVGIASYRIIQNKKEFKRSLNNQRLRIASDLHDEVGSNLGSITLMSQRLVRNSSENQNNKEKLSLIADSAMQTADYIRDFIWCLNPRYDKFVNLESRLRETAGRMLMDISHKFEVNVETMKDESIMETRRNILLMFKEILHNIIKHSEAKSVEISLIRKPDLFRLSVKDDGIGFDVHSANKGNGLQNLKRRAEMLKADLQIKAKNGGGTEVVILFKNDAIT
ncbi:MAG: ATP-binding protein [Bacteroidota bacterium]